MKSSTQSDNQFFAAPVPGGVEFLCAGINEIPDDAVRLETAEYQLLLAVNGKGADLSIQNGQVVVTDWQGRHVDMAAVTKDSNYARPVSPPTLKEQAQSAMSRLMAITQSHGWGVFVPMPDSVATYGKSLAAIAGGSDTASTALPDAPEEAK